MDKWPTAKLGTILRRSEEIVTPRTDTEYREITVRLWGKGVTERGRIHGGALTGRRFVARSGQLIVSRIDARNGAMGLVPQSLEGALVTNDFPLFDLDATKIESKFMNWLCHTTNFVDLCRRASEGTTNRVRLKEEQFFALEIPLPPLAEQRRIVARIEELDAQIRETCVLRKQSIEEIDFLIHSQLAEIFKHEAQKNGLVKLGDLLVDAGYGSSEKCNYERCEEAIPILRIPNIASERINFNDLKYARLSKRDSERLALSKGDILVVRTNGSPELVGRSAVITELDTTFAFASYLIRLRFCEKKISPDYAQYMLRHLRVSGALFELARTTAGQYNVSLGRLRVAGIPVPSIPEQNRIVTELNTLQTELDTLKHLQAETEADVGALLPVVLDHAFNGEL